MYNLNNIIAFILLYSFEINTSTCKAIVDSRSSVPPFSPSQGYCDALTCAEKRKNILKLFGKKMS